MKVQGVGGREIGRAAVTECLHYTDHLPDTLVDCQSTAEARTTLMSHEVNFIIGVLISPPRVVGLGTILIQRKVALVVQSYSLSSIILGPGAPC